MPARITLAEWEDRYAQLRSAGLAESGYGGPLSRHVRDGDLRLTKLRFDDSPAALRLWNFLLTEEDRLHQARAEGRTIVGVMKDLGTTAVLAYAVPNVVAFYPDGAWWIPCIMERSAGLLEVADSLGVPDSFCPVRAMLGAFATGNHFPIPDLLVCGVGATCDDFAAIAQRLEGMGHPILWWEMPHRRRPEADEPAMPLPGGWWAPATQVAVVETELQRVREAVGRVAGVSVDDRAVADGIRRANQVRHRLRELRQLCFTAEIGPMPALELLIVEMLAIHYCSNREEALGVLGDLLDEVHRRVDARQGVLPADAVRVYWVNPVADLRVMNLLEDCGGRICGTEYMFCHALDPIPEDAPPMEALARTALADPMVGSAADRAERIAEEVRAAGAEGVVISRIPGASHCATEGEIIREHLQSIPGLVVSEIEVPPLTDAMQPTIRTRLEALVETARRHRAR